MARGDAARTERFVPVAVVVAADALLLGMFSVLERISAAVRIPILPLASFTHDYGFSPRPSSGWIHLLPR